MINIENCTNLNINIAALEKIANGLTQRDIDVTLCDNKTIQSYNKAYRQQDKPTDVLSFPISNDIIQHEENPMPLGSLIISVDYVIEKALSYGHSNDDELALLFIHGLLHLLGYDHEVDEGEMREKEALIIQNFNLPQSLIIRTEEN